jgi:hypothetical protein
MHIYRFVNEKIRKVNEGPRLRRRLSLKKVTYVVPCCGVDSASNFLATEIDFRTINCHDKVIKLEDNNDKLDTSAKSRPCSSVSRTTPSVRTSPEQNNTAILHSVSSRPHIILQTTGNVSSSSSSCRCRSRTRTKTWRGWMSSLRSEVSSVMERCFRSTLRERERRLVAMICRRCVPMMRSRLSTWHVSG